MIKNIKYKKVKGVKYEFPDSFIDIIKNGEEMEWSKGKLIPLREGG